MDHVTCTVCLLPPSFLLLLLAPVRVHVRRRQHIAVLRRYRVSGHYGTQLGCWIHTSLGCAYGTFAFVAGTGCSHVVQATWSVSCMSWLVQIALHSTYRRVSGKCRDLWAKVLGALQDFELSAWACAGHLCTFLRQVHCLRWNVT